MTAVLIDTGCDPDVRYVPSRSVVQIDATTIYVFFKGTSTAVGYRKSVDGGLNWGAFVPMFGTDSTEQWWDIYYDRWRGSSNGIIHVAMHRDQGTRGMYYNALDTADDSLHTADGTLVFAMGAGPSRREHSLAVSRSGRIYIQGRATLGTGEDGLHAVSTNGGAAWTTTLTDSIEADEDRLVGWADYSSADNDDYLVLYWDDSASEITVKQYDASAGTWSESSAITGMTLSESFGSGHSQWGSALDTADGHIKLVAFDDTATTGVTLGAWNINGSTITAKTDVLASGDYQMCATVSVSPEGSIIAWYGRDSAGASQSAMEVYYKESSDDMVTWGVETAYGTRDGDIAAILVDPLTNGAGVQAVWYEQTGEDLYIDEPPIEIADEPTLTVSGTVVPSATEQEVRDGAQTIVLTLTDATWAATMGDCNEITEALIDGHVSDQDEAHGWNVVVRGGTPYDSEVLADTPLTYWRLGGVTDTSGNSHGIATVGSGVTQGTGSLLIGDSNPSMEFDGANPGLTVTTVAALENIFDGGGTAEAIIMPFSDGESDNGRIVSKGNVWALAVYEQVDSLCRLYFRHAFSITTGLWQTVHKLPLGAIAHVAVTYDNSAEANDPTLWINSVPYTVANGLLSETSTPAGTRTSDASEDIYIGGFGTDVLRFRGRIDEVALYTSELSAARLLAHVVAAEHPVGLTCDDVVRTSDTVVTITMPAFATFDITIDETITVTAPAITHSWTGDLVGTPTFDIITDGTITTTPPDPVDPGDGFDPDPFDPGDTPLDVGFDQPFGRILRIEVAEISPTSDE